MFESAEFGVQLALGPVNWPLKELLSPLKGLLRLNRTRETEIPYPGAGCRLPGRPSGIRITEFPDYGISGLRNFRFTGATQPCNVLGNSLGSDLMLLGDPAEGSYAPGRPGLLGRPGLCWAAQVCSVRFRFLTVV